MGNTAMGAARGTRLEVVLREEIESILRCEARDPSLTDVRVTRVEWAGSRARVWIKIDEQSMEREVEAALLRARGFIRSALAESLAMKKTPELVFRIDPFEEMESE